MNKQIIEEDMVNAENFCPYYTCGVDCYEARMCQWFIDTIQKLQAKEQECERLKKQYNCYACDTCNGKEDYINLKRHCENAIKALHNKQAEFDQLKAENEAYQTSILANLDMEISKRYRELLDENDQLKADREEALKQLEFVRTLNTVQEAENRKLSKTLEEIREDLETQIYCECSECGNNDYSECIKCMTKRYLQKISESEVGNGI